MFPPDKKQKIMNKLIKPLLSMLIFIPFSIAHSQTSNNFYKDNLNKHSHTQVNKFGIKQSMENGLETQKMNFIFKMDYTNSDLPFTTEDAQLLRQFVVYGENTLQCNENRQEVIALSSSQASDQKLVILSETLKQNGYQVNELTCAEEEIVFNIGKSPTLQELGNTSTLPNRAPLIDQSGNPSPFTTDLTADCGDCDKQQLPKNIMEEFKDINQTNKPLMDFGTDFSSSFTTNLSSDKNRTNQSPKTQPQE